MTAYEASRSAFDSWRADELQQRLAKWQREQFGETHAWQQALGCGEELGELAESILGLLAATGKLQHAVLKQAQGIRGFDDADKARRAVADALADQAIFAMQLATSFRLDHATLVRETAEAVMRRRWKST